MATLYRSLSTPLEQIVRLAVRAPEPVIEDACQFAWTRLVVHAGNVRREAMLAWLVKTAVHEAFKLIRRDARELSLEAVLESSGPDAVLASMPATDELLVQREKLVAIGGLPERQRRLLWLHGLGHSYLEMAATTGCTTRTVERQLLRARRHMRAALAE